MLKAEILKRNRLRHRSFSTYGNGEGEKVVYKEIALYNMKPKKRDML